MTAAEALHQLLAAAKQITADECKDLGVWNQLGGAIGVAEMVLRDGEKQEPVAWAVTTDGQFTQNLALYEDVAQGVKKRMDEKYPSQVRKVVPLYAAPVPAQQVVAVPAGYALVPLIVTDEMIVAFAEEWYSKRQTIDDPDMADAYKAMLATAPQPASVSAAPSGEVERDAKRYNAFIGAGLPICFMGSDYNDKAALDAAIDAYSAKE